MKKRTFLQKLFEPAKFSWRSLMLSATLIAALYVLLETVFLATKPSSLSSVKPLIIILFFFCSATLLSGIALLMLVPLYLIGKLSSSEKWAKISRNIALFVPTFIGAALLLLLIDNFTYTVFNFGIINTGQVTRGLYGLLFVVLIIFLRGEIQKLMGWVDRQVKRKQVGQQKRMMLALLGVILVLLLLPVGYRLLNPSPQANFDLTGMRADLPHIILVTGDGVNATHMSVYGYERETTPFLEEMAGSGLMAQNAFPNGASTTGSVTSLLTGKYPAATRVLPPPDVLKNGDEIETLPAILHAAGYYTAQFSFPLYVDAYRLGFQESFDYVNGVTKNQTGLQESLSQFLPSDYVNFLYETGSRLVERLAHIFYIKDMTNAYKIVTTKPEKFEDNQKLEKIFQLLQQTEKPVFVHLHWMGTHGDTYLPDEQVFSQGKDVETQEKYDGDFYDDSILTLDGAIQSLFSELEADGLLDNTIVILASDHGQKFVSTERLPLIFWFPDEAYQGVIPGNVQNLDIAPTILDYLDIPQPQWMMGHSLISNPVNDQPIIAVTHTQKNEAPFHHFGRISVITCDTSYRLNLYDLSWNIKKVAGYQGECLDERLEKEEVLALIKAHLDGYGFDTSGLTQE
jgi:arylsulfatase A-like enzyme